MAWMVLIGSAVLEAVWATALGASDNLTDPRAVAVFVVALVLSMLGLAWATKSIAIGTAYAIWTGLGAALTVGFAIVTGDETVTIAKGVCLAGIIVAVVGLKVLPGHSGTGRGLVGVTRPTAGVHRRHDQH
ncbi:DMT family transporter [Mycolicibacterium aichiense]|uniref:QacE family quaternary ammonium compound efflux SMR transporter n=1 Tax=Mycolicibacterium aichiense TaxID=1799 RepID=A0AAD1MA30_9MYCO|nr:SMR family transporter [Mycolicibacterium aichiense]MCV7020670.1 QacE family quaternary ammonium compound efflux SMR transporter [Mycolicibacterium aichiense]BBX05236.1 QacE family quaternary ammonium compound efflux SMR transporter [Mycolicibacterium aichiense]STZ25411.1 small multidrug resistance protein [Mycolicibacterium aichiense]